MKRLFTDKEACCGCGACVDICRCGAVRMVVDREGFRYPIIDEAKCVDCGSCVQVCPMKTQGREKGLPPQYFGVQAKEEKVRYASSSGGMFPVLAEYVFRQQGVVYGAAYDKHMRVVHREILTMEEMDSIKRTKYVQSSLKGIYRKIEARLKKGQWILFCGTPCQAEGLRLYLKPAVSKADSCGSDLLWSALPGNMGRLCKVSGKKARRKNDGFFIPG